MWGLVLSVKRRVRSAFGFPAISLRNAAGLTSGRASSTDRKARRDVMRLCERETLIAEIASRRAKHLSTSDLNRRLVRLTAEIAADV